MIRLTPDQQKKGAVIVAFVLVAAGILYYFFHDDSPPPTAAPVVVTAPVKVAPVAKTGAVVVVPPGSSAGAAAKNLGTTSAQLDPTLRMEAMLVTESLAYSGSGADGIFFRQPLCRWIFPSLLCRCGRSRDHRRLRHLLLGLRRLRRSI
jgi:hypothetical protein